MRAPMNFQYAEYGKFPLVETVRSVIAFCFRVIRACFAVKQKMAEDVATCVRELSEKIGYEIFLKPEQSLL